MTSQATTTVKKIPVTEIALDSENPRLPEAMLGKSEDEIIRYLYEYYVLQELAESMLDHGYFPSEPLTVLKTAKKTGRKYIVLEGNRRVATLRLLLRDEVPDDIDLGLDDVDASALNRLREVPCHVVTDREDVEALIGFRHIGGLKKWAPDAKARYILQRADRLNDEGSEDPFYDLGRKVGSNSQGMRNSYIAIAILHTARKKFSLSEVNVLLGERRFGVWYRALNSKEVREYIGLDNPTTYDDVQKALGNLKKNRLKEVIGDFVSKGSVPPVLRDSRQITIYGRVLANDKARKLLREAEDFDLAAQVVDRNDLPLKVRNITKSAKLVRDEIEGLEEVDKPLYEAIKALYRTARTMKNLADQLTEPDESEEND